MSDAPEAMAPCPFCGSLEIERRTWVPVANLIRHYIVCSKCLAETGYYDTAGEAIAAWNRRTAEARIRELEEALKDAIPFIGYQAHVPDILKRCEDLVGYGNRETTDE